MVLLPYPQFYFLQFQLPKVHSALEVDAPQKVHSSLTLGPNAYVIQLTSSHVAFAHLTLSQERQVQYEKVF